MTDTLNLSKAWVFLLPRFPVTQVPPSYIEKGKNSPNKIRAKVKRSIDVASYS